MHYNDQPAALHPLICVAVGCQLTTTGLRLRATGANTALHKKVSMFELEAY